MRTTTKSQNPIANGTTTTAGPTDAARPPLLVTIPEAARILSVSGSTIYELIWHDQLVPVRIGRSVRIRHRDLESFVHNELPAEPSNATAASPGHAHLSPATTIPPGSERNPDRYSRGPGRSTATVL